MTIAKQKPAFLDEETAISVLTLAFSSDPAVRWMYPEPHQYLTWFPAFARAFGGRALEHPGPHIIPLETAAALWLPPGIEPDEEEVVDVLFRSVSEERRADLFAMFEQMSSAHPNEPHWYLPLIGVDPAQQRRGQGSTLLRAALALCDRDQVPAYLEATSLENIPLYERHGFNITGTIQAGASPKIFPMVRKPR